MNEHCFTGVIGSIAYIFVPDSIMFSTPVLNQLGGKVYEGEVFFYVSATDLWARVADGAHNKVLELLYDDQLVLECPIDDELAEELIHETALLLIGASFQLSTEQMAAEIEEPQELEQIQQWMRKKEQELNLEEEDINALIMGVYDQKPFD